MGKKKKLNQMSPAELRQYADELERIQNLEYKILGRGVANVDLYCTSEYPLSRLGDLPYIASRTMIERALKAYLDDPHNKFVGAGEECVLFQDSDYPTPTWETHAGDFIEESELQGYIFLIGNESQDNDQNYGPDCMMTC